MLDDDKDKGENELVVLPNENAVEAPIEIPSMCSVCHSEPPVNPMKISCGHIFCFLCIKSVVETTGTCALCRQDIAIDFNRQQHRALGAIQVPSAPKGYSMKGFYEDFRGWWLYDPDTKRELENAYEQNEPTYEKLIAGYVYVIDMRNMEQYRKNEDGRRRKICCETLELENILGVAGLKSEDFTETLEMMRFAESIRS